MSKESLKLFTNVIKVIVEMLLAIAYGTLVIISISRVILGTTSILAYFVLGSFVGASVTLEIIGGILND